MTDADAQIAPALAEKKRLGRNQKYGYGFAFLSMILQFVALMIGKMAGTEFNTGVLMVGVPIITALSGISGYIKGKQS